MMPFDEHAASYDSWFTSNPNLFRSELLLLRRLLARPGRALSVGCGSGLFEAALAREGIRIEQGVEPSSEMAAIARRRGLEVASAPAEELPFPDGSFDTVLLNGIAAYVRALPRVLGEAHRVLRPRGWLVAADVPASSGYGLLYQLAARLGSWHALDRVAPAHPYPIAFLGAAAWRTTEELATALAEAGFDELERAQTLTTHPRFGDDAVEEPSPGSERGSYVAIRARRRDEVRR